MTVAPKWEGDGSSDYVAIQPMTQHSRNCCPMDQWGYWRVSSLLGGSIVMNIRSQLAEAKGTCPKFVRKKKSLRQQREMQGFYGKTRENSPKIIFSLLKLFIYLIF